MEEVSLDKSPIPNPKSNGPNPTDSGVWHSMLIVHRSRFCAMWTDNRGRWLAAAIARRVCVAGKVVPGADRILEGIRAQESGIRAVQIPEESGSGNQESRRVDTG